MYKLLIRPLLFLFDPESVHHFTFRCLQAAYSVPGVGSAMRSWFAVSHPALERKLLGLTFPGPVGLAAGFDKDAKLVSPLAALGFGFIEIGTLTPKPQDGNPRPRLFRLPSDKAIINRMGFNNGGVAAAAARLKRRKPGIIVGGNIGKNKLTPNEQAIDDYRVCFDALEPYVDYFVLNVSSPNTPGLRELQEKEPLQKLLSTVKSLSQSCPKPKPVLLKIAPDLTLTQLDDIVDILRATATDGVIATNTTISRDGLLASREIIDSIGNGGLSGAPLSARSTEVIRYLRSKLGPGYPIIGVGGIMSPQDALEKLEAGADLVQVYTGFIYEGPGFVKRINRYLLEAADVRPLQAI
jgi:dihydroorotate dehydrogenase